ncbi:hypothetical protein [Streptomyces salinarius]|nr:hypothetical protein [Streptomyces salinarius]
MTGDDAMTRGAGRDPQDRSRPAAPGGPRHAVTTRFARAAVREPA